MQEKKIGIDRAGGQDASPIGVIAIGHARPNPAQSRVKPAFTVV
jgi:hypothetical protein